MESVKNQSSKWKRFLTKHWTEFRQKYPSKLARWMVFLLLVGGCVVFGFFLQNEADKYQSRYTNPTTRVEFVETATFTAAIEECPKSDYGQNGPELTFVFQESGDNVNVKPILRFTDDFPFALNDSIPAALAIIQSDLRGLSLSFSVEPGISNISEYDCVRSSIAVPSATATRQRNDIVLFRMRQRVYSDDADATVRSATFNDIALGKYATNETYYQFLFSQTNIQGVDGTSQTLTQVDSYSIKSHPIGPQRLGQEALVFSPIFEQGYVQYVLSNRFLHPYNQDPEWEGFYFQMDVFEFQSSSAYAVNIYHEPSYSAFSVLSSVGGFFSFLGAIFGILFLSIETSPQKSILAFACCDCCDARCQRR